MNYFIFYLLILLNLKALSQPVLLSTDLAPFGSSYNYKGLTTFSAIDTSQQGPNQIWDFSSLIPDGNPSSTQTVFDPSQTIYADSFPAANFGILYLPNTTYEFYSLNSSRMELIGNYQATHPYEYYTNPETHFVFPLTLGIINSDTSRLSVNPSDDFFYFNCIGWGTLKVPGHTYPDVLMRHSIFYRYTGNKIEKYEWLDVTNGMPVFSYTVPFPPSIPEAAYYLYNISSSTEEGAFVSSIMVSNPFHSTLTIKFQNEKQESLWFKIFTLNGQLLKCVQPGDNKSIEINLDMQNEQAGEYLLIIEDAKNRLKRNTYRIIKQ